MSAPPNILVDMFGLSSSSADDFYTPVGRGDLPDGCVRAVLQHFPPAERLGDRLDHGVVDMAADGPPCDVSVVGGQDELWPTRLRIQNDTSARQSVTSHSFLAIEGESVRRPSAIRAIRRRSSIILRP